jgi:hypothetical protein
LVIVLAPGDMDALTGLGVHLDKRVHTPHGGVRLRPIQAGLAFEDPGGVGASSRVRLHDQVSRGNVV